ncbi:MAG: hypothetical protein K8S97_11580 [Anaerolineae bacterium]|nr:hypothetical protein [Anaerolineae bacterium]
MKILNKYMRKYHRWLALPFIAIIIMLAFTKGTPVGNVAQRAQQIMMITLAITGAYLFLLPYLTKWQRRRKRNVSKRAAIQARPTSD